MESIIQSDGELCFICQRMALHTHHIIYGTANRALADKYGLTVRLCHKCHLRVHREPNRGIDMRLKVKAQRAFEIHYPDLNFREVFGRNYDY